MHIVSCLQYSKSSHKSY